MLFRQVRVNAEGENRIAFEPSWIRQPNWQGGSVTATTILIVEDERIVAMDIQQRLVRLGYAVPAMVASGERALEWVVAHPPDLVLMDIHLEGEMDGIEAACRIREAHQIPVVFLTAYSEEKTISRARAAHPYGYLLKPFSERELHATIQMAIETRETSQAKLAKLARLARLAAIIDGSNDAIMSKTLEGIITSWNPQAHRLFGYTASEAIGKPMAMLFPPDRLAEETSFLAHVARGEKIERYETLRIRKDGSAVNVRVTLSPIRDRSGRIVGVSKIAHDITDQMRMAEAQRDSERRQKAALLRDTQQRLENLARAETKRFVAEVEEKNTELVSATRAKSDFLLSGTCQ